MLSHLIPSYGTEVRAAEILLPEQSSKSTISLAINYYLLKNSLAVKIKGTAPFKKARVKKVVKSKGVAKKWL